MYMKVYIIVPPLVILVFCPRHYLNCWTSSSDVLLVHTKTTTTDFPPTLTQHSGGQKLDSVSDIVFRA